MMRRVAVHLGALLLGGALGVWVAFNVASAGTLPPVFAGVVVTAFVFVFQVLAAMLAARWTVGDVARIRTAPIQEVVPRGAETWGWLKPSTGTGSGFPLVKERIRLGRGVEMDITLNNASISRKHAEIQRLIDGALVRDAGSRNGVFVNGMRVEEQLLSDGDNVALGELRFVFRKVVPAARASQEVFAAPGAEAYRSAEVAVRRSPAAAHSADPRGETVVPGDDARPFDDTSEYETEE